MQKQIKELNGGGTDVHNDEGNNTFAETTDQKRIFKKPLVLRNVTAINAKSHAAVLEEIVENSRGDMKTSQSLFGNSVLYCSNRLFRRLGSVYNVVAVFGQSWVFEKW